MKKYIALVLCIVPMTTQCIPFKKYLVASLAMPSLVGTQQTHRYQTDYSLMCPPDGGLVPYVQQSSETAVAHTTSEHISKIEAEQFRELARYAHDFLQGNLERLGAQENESGFVRINIPISSALKKRFEEISKLRVNYWSPDADLTILPESLHTHPQYFESYIINGGYTHEIYEAGSKKDMAFDLYRIFKQGGEKSFAFIGESRLKFIKKESVAEKSIVVFDKDLIHKVVTNTPKALSLNVVFSDSSADVNAYDIYLTKNGTLEDIKTSRKVLINKKSQEIIKEIMSKLLNI